MRRVADLTARRDKVIAERRAKYAKDVHQWTRAYLRWMHAIGLEHAELAAFHRRAVKRGPWKLDTIFDLQAVIGRAVDRLFEPRDARPGRAEDSPQLCLPLDRVDHDVEDDLEPDDERERAKHL